MAKFLQGLEPKTRGIVTVIIVAVVSVLLFFGIKELKNYIRKLRENQDPKQVVDDATSDLNAEINKGEVLSKPTSDYSGTANAISTLLDGCESFTSEVNVIENIIKVVKKPIDWFNLIKVFGTREISDCGTFGYGKTNYDLSSLLKDQLDSSGAYSIDVDGYKKSGLTFETINVLRDYFKTINVTI